MAMQQETRGKQKFGVDNICYDLCTLISEKGKGIEAYEQYLQDAQGDSHLTQVLQQCRDQDKQAVQQLSQALKQHMSSGH